MAIYGYTKNYKLIKPQFNTDTWHDYIYDNLDTIDAIMSAIYASGNWQGFWQKNTQYDVGDVIIDRDTDTMYKVLVEHTTSENTFALEQAAHPTYYELWSPNNLAESWAIDMDGLVSSVDYSSKAYAISSALIDAGSAKEWAIKTGGSVGTTGEYSAKKHATDAASSASTAASEASNAANSATLSQKWAVDANLVASTDYSSKSWATGSLDAGSAKDWAIKEGGQVGTTGKYSAKVYSLAAENHCEKARDWASKTNGQVESTDYSAKAYAISEGLISAGSAKEWSNKAKAWATSSTIIEDGKYGASYYALQAYNANVSAQNAKTRAQEWASKMDGQVASTDYSSKYYAGQAANSATAAQDALDNVHGLIATPIGTIFQSIYVDESMDIARQLNGQLISSTKFTGFRGWLDTVQTAIPNLFTDEATWQAEKLLSKFGQVGKFVIDDVAHTIRLPAVVNPQGLLSLSGIGNLVNESLPNITGNVTPAIVDSSSGTTGALPLTGLSGALYNTATASSRKYFNSAGIVSGSYNFALGLDASLSSSTYQNDAPVQQEAIQYPYYIQVATGVEESLPAIREYKVNNSDYFGKSMYSENAPYNASWLASNGQYNASSLYPDFWTQLTGVELNGSLNVGDTIEISGKTYVKRGLPVVLSTGTITDYDFVVNQNDQTFRLPLLNGERVLVKKKEIDGNGSWYNLYSDGWLEQGGQVDQNVAEWTQVSLMIPYKNKLYRALATQQFSQDTYFKDASIGINTIDSATFRISCYSQAGQMNWKAYGYTNIPTQSDFTEVSGLYYYVGDTVQDASLINAGAVLGQLANKADIDASNFNADGKSLLSGLGMPSDRYIDLTLGASGSTYTAPANGYFVFGKQNGTSEARFVRLTNASNDIAVSDSVPYTTNVATVTILVKKGSVIRIMYDCTGATDIFRFVYAEGEK